MVNKHLFFILLAIFLTIPIAYSQSVSTVSDGWNVTWELVHDGISKKVYEITVQNLLEEKRYFNLGVLFQQTNFPLEQIRNVYLYCLLYTSPSPRDS